MDYKAEALSAQHHPLLALEQSVQPRPQVRLRIAAQVGVVEAMQREQKMAATAVLVL